MGLMESSHKVNKEAPSSYSINNFEDSDRITEIYGEKPSSTQILEIAKNKERNHSKTFTPPTSKLNIDLGGWINNAKILVPVTEIMKIPSQKI